MSSYPKISALLAVVAALGTAAPAMATTYFFHFQGDPADTTYGDVLIDGHFLTAGPLFPSAITGVTGTVSGGSAAVVDGAITALSAYAQSDNTLYNIGTAGDYSFGGVSFTVVNAAQTATADYNLFDQGSATFLLVSTIDSTGYAANSTSAAPGPVVSDQNAQLAPPTADVGLDAPVPEPASWALMLIGFGLAGGATRARRQASSARA